MATVNDYILTGKNYFIESSVVWTSVILAFNHKKIPLKKCKKYMLFVNCTFEDSETNAI